MSFLVLYFFVGMSWTLYAMWMLYQCHLEDPLRMQAMIEEGGGLPTIVTLNILVWPFVLAMVVADRRS